jgi:type III pantothenate kinase
MYERFTDPATNPPAAQVPQINSRSTAGHLVAVDIGNSSIKFGQFPLEKLRGQRKESSKTTPEQSLPEPIATFELPIAHDSGCFDAQLLSDWCQAHFSAHAHWSIGSVHRGAGTLLATTLADWAKQLGIAWTVHRLENTDLPIVARVDKPVLVGIDRLLAAVAANKLRAPDRAAIVIDLGTATTVDLVEADGAFAGGAILPGIGMASRALAEQTDALPRVMLDESSAPPSPLGKSTKAAIEAGLYWGAVGAIAELASKLAAAQPAATDYFITGGASPAIAASLARLGAVRFVPHLVLAGIAIVDSHDPGPH